MGASPHQWLDGGGPIHLPPPLEGEPAMQCPGLHEGKTVNGEIGDISLNLGPKEKKAFNLRKHEFGYGHQKENKNKRLTDGCKT